MTHRPYVLDKEEFDELVNSVIRLGSDEVYDAMRRRAFTKIKQVRYADEILMDQHLTILGKARKLIIKNEDDKELYKTLCDLASMLRKLAHEIHREYLRMNAERDSLRFLHIVR